MSSLIRRPNGIYYQIINQGGKRIWRSTGARTHSAAIAAIHNGLERNTPKRCVTVSQFYVDFLLYARTNLAATTVDLYDRAVKNFVRLVGDRPLREYTAQDIERFKSLRAQEVGPITLNIGFRNVKAFFETAVKWQLIERNPFKGVKQVRVPPQRPTYSAVYQLTVANSLKDEIRVTEADFGSGTAGYARGRKGRFSVAINQNLHLNDKYSTMVHELGPYLCRRSSVDTDIKELEAESISFLVCRRRGLATTSEACLTTYLSRATETPSISFETVITVAGQLELMGKGMTRPQRKGTKKPS